MTKLYVRIYKSPKRRNWIANIVQNPRKKTRALKTITINVDLKSLTRKRKL